MNVHFYHTIFHVLMKYFVILSATQKAQIHFHLPMNFDISIPTINVNKEQNNNRSGQVNIPENER